jgi:hypothetical protein
MTTYHTPRFSVGQTVQVQYRIDYRGGDVGTVDQVWSDEYDRPRMVAVQFPDDVIADFASSEITSGVSTARPVSCA